MRAITLRQEHGTCAVCTTEGHMRLVSTPERGDGMEGLYEYECRACGHSRHYTVREMNAIKLEAAE